MLPQNSVISLLNCYRLFYWNKIREKQMTHSQASMSLLCSLYSTNNKPMYCLKEVLLQNGCTTPIIH